MSVFCVDLRTQRTGRGPGTGAGAEAAAHKQHSEHEHEPILVEGPPAGPSGAFFGRRPVAVSVADGDADADADNNHQHGGGADGCAVGGGSV